MSTGKKQELDDSQRARLIKAYQSGIPISALVKRFPVNRYYIRQVLEDEGIVIRRGRQSHTGL